MLSNPLTTALLLMGISALAVSESLPGLLDALVASGASKFAEFIQSDPDVLSLYLSGQVQTVFAPSDSAPDLASGNETLAERAISAAQAAAARYQSSGGITSLGIASRSHPGDVIPTNNQSPLLGGDSQRIVVDTRPVNETSPTKRWVSSYNLRRQANGTAPSQLRISTGLGKITNVIQGDIPYDGGIIHITDSYFTMPQSLSSTSKETGQTAFVEQLSQSNTTSKLDNTQSVTVFLPSNAAFASSNSSTPSSQLVSDHVVPGVSYLPDLQDGTILTTQRGETLAISVRSGRYYVNGGLITQANLVLENGVAHVVNKVLQPTPAAPVPGAASTNSMNLAGLFGVVSYIGMMILA
ncbi:FAS1 domain-containing protein [Hypoxylon rubiginosum]|uniref:FAS1 domain-containing protein n=1 Tax=Hypoxylon rubiginosum TaxID=110542 RepID=A0ACB9YHE8_9PEZI|nr:FAS1 domain-containing protein [Hypoxylon rubiginosum]